MFKKKKKKKRKRKKHDEDGPVVKQEFTDDFAASAAAAVAAAGGGVDVTRPAVRRVRKSYSCLMCNMTFSKKASFAIHKIRHSGNGRKCRSDTTAIVLKKLLVLRK